MPAMTLEQEKLFDVISRAVNNIVYRWSIFEQLYGSKEKVDLLNKSGSNVFQLFQRLVIDDVILTLCRLTDPERSMGRENASIRNLLAKVRSALPADTASQIDAELKELDDHLQSGIRVLRNKAISHMDLEHALNAELLPHPTYDDIDRSLALVKSILNKIRASCSAIRRRSISSCHSGLTETNYFMFWQRRTAWQARDLMETRGSTE